MAVFWIMIILGVVTVIIGLALLSDDDYIVPSIFFGILAILYIIFGGIGLVETDDKTQNNSKDSIYCVQCGDSIEKEYTYCPDCGTKIVYPE